MPGSMQGSSPGSICWCGGGVDGVAAAAPVLCVLHRVAELWQIVSEAGVVRDDWTIVGRWGHSGTLSVTTTSSLHGRLNQHLPARNLNTVQICGSRAPLGSNFIGCPGPDGQDLSSVPLMRDGEGHACPTDVWSLLRCGPGRRGSTIVLNRGPTNLTASLTPPQTSI